jgi:hypothetical protein
MHLKTEDLVDLAEGTRPESSAPHLAGCASCQRQLSDLRAIVSAVADSGGRDVPEPSALFWDHLSARVQDAVATEGAPRSAWRLMWSWPRMMAPITAMAAAALLLAAGATMRVGMPSVATDPISIAAVPSGGGDLSNEMLGGDDDPSLILVADLSTTLDSTTAGEAGLAQDGSADHAVTHMNDVELRELRRLLVEALAKS